MEDTEIYREKEELIKEVLGQKLPLIEDFFNGKMVRRNRRRLTRNGYWLNQGILTGQGTLGGVIGSQDGQDASNEKEEDSKEKKEEGGKKPLQYGDQLKIMTINTKGRKCMKLGYTWKKLVSTLPVCRK